MQNLTKFKLIQKWLTQNMWHIGAVVNITNNKPQNISFKNPFYEKGVIHQKNFKGQ
jgi:hypothetical protein